MIEFDLVVVGGGPAGLSAAIAAARHGLTAALFEENRTAGGSLRYRLGEVDSPNGGRLRGPAAARALVDELFRQRVQIATGAVAWSAYPGFVLGVTGVEAHREVQARQLVLATGSTDLAVAFPGSDLPGVMTGSAMLRLLHIQRVWPGGKRIAIVGEGDLADDVAEAVRLAGGEVVARGSAEGAAAGGHGVVEQVTIDGATTEADVVAICAGRQPDIAMALALEAAAGYSAALGGFVPVRSESLETNLPGLFVCGSAGGVGPVAASLAEGTLAGTAAAVHAGKAPSQALRQEIDRFQQAFPERAAAIAAVQPEWTQHFVESVTAGARG